MSAHGYVLGERTPMRGASRAGHRLFAFIIAVVAIAASVAVWWYFIETSYGQAIDESSRVGVSDEARRIWGYVSPVLDVVSVPFIVVAVVVAAVVAAARRRWLIVVQVALVVIGSNVTTQVLKHSIIERPDLGMWSPANSLPSGHTTVAASIAAALILVLPPISRAWITVLGGLYATLTGLATLVMQWHRFSDVVVALLIVLAWFAIACAISSPSTFDNPQPDGHRSVGTRVTVFVLAGGGMALAVMATLIGRDLIEVDGNHSYIDVHGAHRFGMLAIMATAALCFAAMLGLRHMLARGYSAGQGVSGPERVQAERRVNALPPLGVDTVR